MSNRGEKFEEIRNAMDPLQKDLKDALTDVISDIGNKLNKEELDELENEFRELNELLEAIKENRVTIAVFGKTCTGKSSLVNALLRKDVAKVDVGQDTTKIPEAHLLNLMRDDVSEFSEGKWKIIDMPGTMSDPDLEKKAFNETKKSHGVIFVINENPTEPEIAMFDEIHKASLKIPKIVFVNKWDERRIPRIDKENLKAAIRDKMAKYVTSEEEILFGSAMILDDGKGVMVRQEVPELIDALYNSAGTLEAIMGVIDPAERAGSTTDKMNNKVLKVRQKAARRAVNVYSFAAVAGTFVPYDSFFVAPAIHTKEVSAVFKIMGWKDGDKSLAEASASFVKDYYFKRWFWSGALALTESLFSTLGITGIGYPIDVAIELAGLSYFKFLQAAVIGEFAIEFSSLDFDWGARDLQSVVERCKKQATENYLKFTEKFGEKVGWSR